MLVDHVSEHVLRILLKSFAPDAGATPGNFFPNHETKLIAQIKYQPVLLVVRETDEVCAHLTDELHLFAHQIVTHGGSHARVIRMTLRAAQEHPFAVQLERTMLDKLELAYAKALRRDESRPQGWKASPGSDRGGATRATRVRGAVTRNSASSVKPVQAESVWDD